MSTPSLRDFRIQGPFGLNIAVSTNKTGVISVTLPRYHSEPPAERSKMVAESSLQRACSVTHIPVYVPPKITLARTDSNESVATEVDTTEEGDLDMETARREPSPAPTDIHNPEPDVIFRDLARRNIKVRDFAYEPRLTPATREPFNAVAALAEFDYRTSQIPRAYPVPGRVTRRLLNIGWITEEEVQMRCSEVDMQLLREYDEKPRLPFYVIGGDRRPRSHGERANMKNLYARERFYPQDKLWERMEERRRYEEESREEAERALERILSRRREEGRKKRDEERRAKIEQMSPRSKKRALEEMEAEERNEAEESNAKRQRVSPDDEDSSWSQYQSQSQQAINSSPWHQKVTITHPAMQVQCPVPMSYVPEGSSISASGSHRTEPDEDDRVPTPPLEEPEPEPPKNPNPSRRGLKRTLSRTQTFSQL